MSKHSQVQPLHYSASAVQNSYNSMRIIRPFLDKLRLWQKMLNNLLRKAFKKRNRCHSIPAQVILSISYYTKFSRIIFFFCTFFLISSNIFYHNFKLYFMRENLLQRIFFPVFCRIWDIFIRNFLKLWIKKKGIDSKKSQ